MLNQLKQLRAEAIAELSNVDNLTKLEAWRIHYLGKKGSLTSILRGLGKLPLEERREIGATANEIKAILESGLEQKEQTLKRAVLAATLEQGRIDVTMPGYPVSLGRIHPTTQMLREICEIFSSMGFQV